VFRVRVVGVSLGIRVQGQQLRTEGCKWGLGLLITEGLEFTIQGAGIRVEDGGLRIPNAVQSSVLWLKVQGLRVEVEG